jgi:hypothetical protein
MQVNSQGKIEFEKYFTNACLRIDYMHSGTAKSENVALKKVIKTPFWAGNPNKLIDSNDYGAYRMRVYDVESETLIYTYGFCSLFEEWQTTAQALQTEFSFQESLLIPYPLKPIKIELTHRDNKNNNQVIFETVIDPAEKSIEDRNLRSEINYKEWLHSGASGNKVDIAVLAEGYTADEMQKFHNDADKLLSFLFNEAPFKERMSDFNVYLVESISSESGTDIPGKSIWKNTALNSNFYTFGSERYLTTADYHVVCDAASVVPFDQIMIIVNSDMYGGGGIYNFYSISSASNFSSKEVLSHEFGHAFSALGDEYYTSSTAYNDFYDLNTEPYQANLTTLVDFDKKWKDMLDEETPIPTPDNAKYKTKVGVYEGGGYMEKGIYRPMQHCRMKELNYSFCPVCQRAINNMIDYYAK